MFSNFLVLTYRFRYFRKGKSEKGCVEIEDWGFSVHFVLSFRYFWEGTSEKGCVEIEDWGFSVHFVLGFEENSIYTWHFCFRQGIAKWCKVYTEADSWFQKSHDEFEQKTVESPKSWNVIGFYWKKYIHSAKTFNSSVVF